MRKDLGRGVTGRGYAKLGQSGRGKQHSSFEGEKISRPGWAGLCGAWQGRANNTSPFGEEDFSVRRGRAMPGKAGLGKAQQTTSPERGTAFMASQSRALQGWVWRGIHASPARGTDFLAWQGQARRVRVRQSRAWIGMANTPPEREEDFAERLRSGEAWFGKAWHGKQHPPLIGRAAFNNNQ